MALPRWTLDEEAHSLEGPKSDSVEILAEFAPGDGPRGFRVRVADDGTGGIPVIFDGSNLTVDGESVPFSLRDGESALRLHLFLDRSVLEVFANDRLAVARVIDAPRNSLRILATVPEGRNSLKRLDAWTIPTEGLFRDVTAPPAH